MLSLIVFPMFDLTLPSVLPAVKTLIFNDEYVVSVTPDSNSMMPPMKHPRVNVIVSPIFPSDTTNNLYKENGNGVWSFKASVLVA